MRCRSPDRAGDRRFRGESEPRRRKILDTILDLGPTVTIYDASRHRYDPVARHARLVALVPDILSIGAERLALESEDAGAKSDRVTLFAELRKTRAEHRLRYDHLRAHEECLLAIPDAIAWCWARGGQWRARVQEIVTRVQPV